MSLAHQVRAAHFDCADADLQSRIRVRHTSEKYCSSFSYDLARQVKKLFMVIRAKIASRPWCSQTTGSPLRLVPLSVKVIESCSRETESHRGRHTLII